MDTPRKLIVGYDLCEDYSQISCYSYKSKEPLTLSMGERADDDNPIPTVLCVKTETKQWLFGEEAISCAHKGEGILVDHLISKACNNEMIELFGTKFTGVALLEKFMRKSLTLIKNHFPTEPITKIVVTVHNTEPVLVDKIYETLDLLGIEKQRAAVISHASAYLYYALSQDRSLWTNDVGLFDYHDESLMYYQIVFNRRVKPMIAALSKTDFSQELELLKVNQRDYNASYIFENIANTALHKQIVSTLYFTGNGFQGNWADDIMGKLCAGRRVFAGQNLFSKGACYAAKELTGDKKLNDVFLFHDDMIATSVALRVYCDTKYKDIPLAQAGEPWYEVNRTYEVILEGEPELDLVLSHSITRDIVRKKILLDRLPERPDRSTRLSIHFSCQDKTKGNITVTDLGFGEFFTGTDAKIVITLEI